MDFIDEIIWPSSTDDASIATTDDVTLATEQTTSILVTWSTTKVPEGDDGLSTGAIAGCVLVALLLLALVILLIIFALRKSSGCDCSFFSDERHESNHETLEEHRQSESQNEYMIRNDLSPVTPLHSDAENIPLQTLVPNTKPLSDYVNVSDLKAHVNPDYMNINNETQAQSTGLGRNETHPDSYSGSNPYYNMNSSSATAYYNIEETEHSTFPVDVDILSNVPVAHASRDLKGYIKMHGHPKKYEDGSTGAVGYTLTGSNSSVDSDQIQRSVYENAGFDGSYVNASNINDYNNMNNRDGSVPIVPPKSGQRSRITQYMSS